VLTIGRADDGARKIRVTEREPQHEFQVAHVSQQLVHAGGFPAALPFAFGEPERSLPPVLVLGRGATGRPAPDEGTGARLPPRRRSRLRARAGRLSRESGRRRTRPWRCGRPGPGGSPTSRGSEPSLHREETEASRPSRCLHLGAAWRHVHLKEVEAIRSSTDEGSARFRHGCSRRCSRAGNGGMAPGGGSPRRHPHFDAKKYSSRRWAT
jgi:hypothetical protein